MIGGKLGEFRRRLDDVSVADAGDLHLQSGLLIGGAVLLTGEPLLGGSVIRLLLVDISTRQC